MVKKEKTSKQMLISSAIMFGFSCLLFISVTVAWFAYANKIGEIDVVVANPNVEASLYYETSDDVWESSNVLEQTPGTFFFDNIRPNDVFNYKVELRNNGDVAGTIGINFNGITCLNEVDGVPKCVSNRLQIKQIKVYSATYGTGEYTQGVEVTNVTNNVGADKYLVEATSTNLAILQDYNLQLNEAYIIYFSIWFNPDYAYGIPTPILENNSNEYINSELKIENINITLDQERTPLPNWG